MSEVHLLRAGQLVHVASHLESAGSSPERILRDANLPYWHYCHPDDLVPSRHAYSFLHHAAREMGTDTFGLSVASANPVESISSLGHALRRSLTNFDALLTLCRLFPWHNSTSSYWLARSPHGLWLCRKERAVFEVGRRQMELYALQQMIKTVRLGAGPSWKPPKIALYGEPPPGLKDTPQFEGVEILSHRGLTAVAIPRAVLAREIPRAGTGQGAGRDRAPLPGSGPGRDFVGSLRALIGTLLSQQAPSIHAIAEIAGFSVRSLQRRLGEAGLTYSELVDQARYQKARERLVTGQEKITEIALDVGYSDGAHFCRAFRRWSGVSPREFRRLHA